MGGLDDAGSLSDFGTLAWALFAAAAGMFPVVAAMRLIRPELGREPDYDRGYNALAPLLD